MLEKRRLQFLKQLWLPYTETAQLKRLLESNFMNWLDCKQSARYMYPSGLQRTSELSREMLFWIRAKELGALSSVAVGKFYRNSSHFCTDFKLLLWLVFWVSWPCTLCSGMRYWILYRLACYQRPRWLKELGETLSVYWRLCPRYMRLHPVRLAIEVSGKFSLSYGSVFIGCAQGSFAFVRV